MGAVGRGVSKVIYDGQASGEARDQSWDYCRIALDFFREHKVPFWDTHIDMRRNRRTIISSHVRLIFGLR